MGSCAALVRCIHSQEGWYPKPNDCTVDLPPTQEYLGTGQTSWKANWSGPNTANEQEIN